MKDEIDVYHEHSNIISKIHKDYRECKKTAVKTVKEQSSPKTKAQFIPQTELEFFYEFLSELRKANYKISEYRFFDKLDDFAKIIKRPLCTNSSYNTTDNKTDNQTQDEEKYKKIKAIEADKARPSDKVLEAAKTTYISQYIRDSKSKGSQENLTLLLAFVSCYYQDKTKKFYKEKLHSLQLKFCPLDEQVIENYRQEQEEALKGNTEPEKLDTENQQEFDNLSPSNISPYNPNISFDVHLTTVSEFNINPPYIITPTEVQPTPLKRIIKPKHLGEREYLNPMNDISIPYVGRKDEFDKLDRFVSEDTDVAEDKIARIWAMVAPSGAGKTRLAYHWLFNSSEVKDWDKFLLTNNTKDTKFWQSWMPVTSTILIVDYVYGYEQTIESIIKRFQNLKENKCVHRLRLLLLDHVFPQNIKNLSEYKKYNFHSMSGERKDELYPLFYQKEPLSLQETSDQSEIIVQLIRHRAGSDVSQDYIQEASNYLKNIMKNAWHPLFALLLGDAIRDKQDFKAWTSRRNLIEYYFSGDKRLPWLDGTEEGLWSSLCIAVATARRGIKIELLEDMIPENCSNQIITLCNAMIASHDLETLQPFEPDIMGETFFLKFLNGIFVKRDIKKKILPSVIQILTKGDEDEQNKVALDFIAFITRLVRNLCNDSQDDHEIQNFWKALCQFLNPKTLDIYFSFLMALAVSAALVESVQIIQEHHPERLADIKNRMFSQIDFEALCYQHNNYAVLIKSVECAMRYYEEIAENNTNNHSLEADLIELLHYYEKFNIEFYQLTALMEASYLGCERVVALLFEKNLAQINTQSEGWTALMIASNHGHTDIVKKLLNKEAKTDLQNNAGWTALMLASYQGHTDIAKELLDHKAKPDLQHKDGWTALRVASQQGHTGIVKELLTHNANPDLRSDDSWTALMEASYQGYTEIAKELLAYNANPNLQDMDGGTALMMTSMYGHTDIVKKLLNKEAKTDLQNNAGWTALMLASYQGHTDIAKELLTHNAHPDLQDNNDTTALMQCSHKGHTDIVRELLSKEANTDLQNNKGWTALMFASDQGYTDIVKKLLVHNANTTLQNEDGGTALMIALSQNHPDITDLLLEKDAPLKTGLHYQWHDIMPASIDHYKHNKISTSHFNSFALVENANDYPWKPPSQAQIELLKTAKIFFKHENHWTNPCVTAMILPWCQKQVSLICIRDTSTIQNPLTIYCIEYKNHYFRLTGEPALLNYLRRSASFKLTYNTALDYLRFFCFFLRGASVAFNIIDPDLSHWQNNLILPENQSLSSPKITNIDEQGNYECDAVVSYGFYICQAQFYIDNDGNVMPNVTPLEESLCRSEYEMLVSNHFIFTPLMTACKAGFKKVVKQLIEEGVDISVEDHEGKTALSYAQESGHTEIVDMLREAEANKKP